ncbi:MAG: ATP-binding protein, partial [Anaerolineae bacterium]
PSPHPSVTVEEKLELERKKRLLNVMTVSGIIVCMVFLLLMILPIFSSSWIYLSVFGILLGCCIVSFLLNRWSHFIVASALFTLGLMLAILAVVVAGIFEFGLLGFVIYYLPLTVLVAGMLFGSRATFGFAALNTLLIIAVTLLTYFTISMDTETLAGDVLAVAIPAAVLCFLMALVAWLYGSSLEGALRRLTEQSQQLQIANEEIRAFSRTLEDKVEDRTYELREFVAMVAHDLRNPLTVISGYAEILQEEPTPASHVRQDRAVNTIASNVDHMLHLTDDLLELSRLRSGTIEFDMEPLPIEMVIEEVCTSFEPQMAVKRLGLKLELPPELPLVWGDHLRLTQVLNNLVSNAYNYTPSGAIIVAAQPDDGLVEISVSDTGIGIPEDEQRRLFTHFFRGEHELVRSQRGTGLGLSIAHSIVQAHGGNIWAESQVGKGSTFRFTLPVAQNQPADNPTAADREAV